MPFSNKTLQIGISCPRACPGVPSDAHHHDRTGSCSGCLHCPVPWEQSNLPSHKNVPCALEPVFPFPNFALLCQTQRTLTIPPLPQWCPRSGPAQICAVCQNLAQMPDALFCPSFRRSDTGSWTIEVARLFLYVQISTKSLGYSTTSVTTQQFPGV